MTQSLDVEIRRLDASEAREHLDDLAAVLVDCVEGGASVGYLAPFSHDEAFSALRPWALQPPGRKSTTSEKRSTASSYESRPVCRPVSTRTRRSR